MSESLKDKLDFDLPEERIAISPAEPRDSARLLVFNRKTQTLEHLQISDLKNKLFKGDLLIFNDTRVDPVRIPWRKPGGGEAEVLLLKCVLDETTTSTWEALVSGRNLQFGQKYLLPQDTEMTLISELEKSRRIIRLTRSRIEVSKWLQSVGMPPLPPYIRKARKKRGSAEDRPDDVWRYQTEFAEKSGAVAAPTAGLHFTRELLTSLATLGVEIEFVTLAVGWGTFMPVDEEQWRQKRLHAEKIEISKTTAEKVLRAKKEGRRVIAVGTTVVRALEWWQRNGSSPEGYQGECDLFLQPPWESKIIDGLVTNFHLPGSSLLALVAGFVGQNGIEKILELYRTAIKLEYRFFSYGDAMLIL